MASAMVDGLLPSPQLESLEESDGHPFAPPRASVDSPVQTQPPPAPSGGLSDEAKSRMDKVLQSDIGITTLLARLKQSIASARDFATFLKKRSSLEDEHAQGLKKLCRATHESVHRQEHRQGSYAHNYEEMTRIHERMADNGLQFAMSLHQMSDDLNEMAANIDRGRKQWKQSGLNAEKRVQDAEALMEKAKAKYDSLAEQYDRARTGERQSGKFGLKGTKSAAQQEEALHTKVQAADSDYASKVQAAKTQRQELISTLRPQAVRALQDLIAECDSGLTLQLQKFATFNEKLLLGNALCVSPLNHQANGAASGPRSLREVAHQIDNEKDLSDYVISFSSKAGTRTSEIKYEKHPTLSSPKTTQPTAQRQSLTMQTQPSSFSGPVHAPDVSSPQSTHAPQAAPPVQSPTSLASQQFQQPPPPTSEPQHQRQTSQPAGLPPIARQEPITLSAPSSGPPTNGRAADLPPLNPVFGVSLDDLFRRDGSAVPMIVYQCLQAVDLFGLEVEGIYRTSGSTPHILEMKALFDHDSSAVDFRDPSAFHHDIASVTGLLKRFFQELPDPLLTGAHYGEFIHAARIDDDIVRRDSLHAIINGLPDPNYATLRVLTLHLNRVQEHSHVNRMTAQNLAICFGPTLLGPQGGAGANISDAGWCARVIETILVNTFQIFDDDE